MTLEHATVHRLDTSNTCRCRFRKRARAHHDRLLLLLADADSMLDLFELAVTWAELDYSEHALIPPNQWVDFAMEHTWPDTERACRALGLAADVALGAQRVHRAALVVAGGR